MAVMVNFLFPNIYGGAVYSTRRFLWYWPKGLKFRRKKLRKQIGWPSFKHKLNKGTPFLSKKNKIKLKRKNGQKFFLCWKTHLSCGCRFQGNFPPFEHWREKKVRCALLERPSGAVFLLFPFFLERGYSNPEILQQKKKVAMFRSIYFFSPDSLS